LSTGDRFWISPKYHNEGGVENARGSFPGQKSATNTSCTNIIGRSMILMEMENGWKLAMVEIEEISSIAANAAISSKLAKLAKKENLTKMAKMTKLTFTHSFYKIKISYAVK
jgi:hypothetical protein